MDRRDDRDPGMGGAEIMEDSLSASANNISFPKLLLWHMNRLSYITAAPTNIREKSFAFWLAVDALEAMMSPYHDAELKAELEKIEKLDGISFGNTYNDSSNVYVNNPIDVIEIARMKFRALMGLMSRKNLLLMETAELEIKE